MSKFKIGDVAYYWEIDCYDISEIYLGEIDIENEVQAKKYSSSHEYYHTKKAALDAFYERLREIEGE